MKRNLVAKHLREFNRSAKHRDRKNDYTRKGKSRSYNKGKMYEEV